MKILIKQARITDPQSALNGQILDILTENGIIRKIAPSIQEKADQIISIPGVFVSPGWTDIFANFGDPGYEFKETLETGAAAAAAGGFTDVVVIPNTSPVADQKSTIEYIIGKSRLLKVNIHPAGAVTRKTEGKDLAEMYDMYKSGASVFTDGTHCIQSAGLLVKALQYVKPFGGLIMQVPEDHSINPHGLMHEGVISTQLGLPGKPAMAEELMVARDIELTFYADSRIHITGVSTARSLELIRQGKEKGTGISCSVTPYHLYFCDEDLEQYNSNLKVNPPLRTKEDRSALKAAILSGIIDCIATHHMPHEYDSKVKEFEYAQPGMIGLETAFGVLNTAVPGINPEKWVELLSINPRRIIGLDTVEIAEGKKASLTLFDPAETWTVTATDLYSKSSNTPFLGATLTGKVKGIINGDQFVLNSPGQPS